MGRGFGQFSDLRGGLAKKKDVVYYRLRNLAITIVPLPRRYRKQEMAGTIFRYRQYFYLQKQCHKSV